MHDKTNSLNSEDALIKEAKKRLRIKDSFKQHRNSYIIINGAFALMDFLPDKSFNWFFYISISWGIGLLFDYIETVKKLKSSNNLDKEIEYLKRRTNYIEEGKEKPFNPYTRKSPEKVPEIDKKK